MTNFSIKRAFSTTLSAILAIMLILPQGIYAQNVLDLPPPGALVTTSINFTPANIRGMTIHPDNPLQFDFIIDTGDDDLRGNELEKEASKLVKYFLASLTVPENDMWVNLSPYEENRIIPDSFGVTQMGLDMLAQDYILKQLTASLVNPDDELGAEFWGRVYEKAQKLYGHTNIPVNTFNKVWIIPDKAVIYENNGSVFVAERHLKVLLEEDYLALKENIHCNDCEENHPKKDSPQEINGLSSDIIREVLIPEIEQEVNHGKNFATLRQIFNSMILATWFKKNLRETLLGQTYIDKNKTKGIDLDDKEARMQVYNQYVEAFKKGVFNFIREDYDTTTKAIVPRKYFSGGVGVGVVNEEDLAVLSDDLDTQSPSVRESVLEPESQNGRDVRVRWQALEDGTLEEIMQADKPMGQEDSRDIPNVGYFLERVEYEGAREIMDSLGDPETAKATIKELFPRENFYVQNNRRMNRKTFCSGRCWFCYAHRKPLVKRQEETSPMAVSDAVAMVNRAIELGFENLQINGEDSLDDLDSFWAIVDASKDKPIGFNFFSNGFSLIRNAEQSLEFFQQLKERLGSVKRISLTLSWDPEKVERAKKAPEFSQDEDLVYGAMATVIHNFRQVFPKAGESVLKEQYSLSVDAHDLGTQSSKQADKVYNEFHGRVQKALAGKYGYEKPSSLYTYMDWGKLEFHTPESVVEGIKRGRIYRLFTVEGLFKAMAKKRMSTCNYSPFFDLSMGEIVTCIRRQEYPRRKITPQNFDKTLLAPFFNPRTRHLFLGDNGARSVALVKQLGFALALNPSLRRAMQVSFEEVESHMFSNQQLMKKIELLFLLEDIINTSEGQDNPFAIRQVPKELIDVLLGDEILTAWLTYYSKYRVEDRLSYTIDNIVSRFHHDSPEDIEALRKYIRDNIIESLEEREIITADVIDDVPDIEARSADDKERAELPDFDTLGLNVRDRLEQGLRSENEKERQVAFNLLSSMATDGYDLDEFRDILLTNLTVDNLSESEQTLVVDLMEEWSGSRKYKPRGDSDIAFQLVTPFIFNAPEGSVRAKAVKYLIETDDDTFLANSGASRHTLSPETARQLFEARAQVFSFIDTLTRIKLYRKWIEFGMWDINNASEAVAELPLPEDLDKVLEEIGNWEDKSTPFRNILEGVLLSKDVQGYRKIESAEMLAETPEGRITLLEYIRGEGRQELGEYYLDALAILVEKEDTRETAIALLNELPLSHFEQQDTFVHVTHHRLHDKLLKFHSAPEMGIMAHCIDSLSAGSLITSALEQYMQIKQRMQQEAREREDNAMMARVDKARAMLEDLEVNNEEGIVVLWRYRLGEQPLAETDLSDDEPEHASAQLLQEIRSTFGIEIVSKPRETSEGVLQFAGVKYSDSRTMLDSISGSNVLESLAGDLRTWLSFILREDELRQKKQLLQKANETEVSDDGSEVGGIDFNANLLEMYIEGKNNWTPTMIRKDLINEMNADGYYPIIINISPVSVPLLFGVKS